jgi:hypothetical protein
VTDTTTDPTPARKPRRPRRTPDGPVEPAGDVVLATAETPPGDLVDHDHAVAALAALGEVPGWVEVLRATLDDQHARLMAFEQLAGSPDARDAVDRALGERDSAMVECDRLRAQLAETHGPQDLVGFVAGCSLCIESNDPEGDAGHHCTECREGGGEWTPTPHGHDLCPAHVRHLVEVVQRLEGDDDALLTDPNGEAGELSAEQVEALADKLAELLGSAGGWVGVQRRWADIPLGACFLGRKGDLWLVTKAAGEPSEFDKGKVTVKVYGISPSKNPAEYARSFDADELATVLVPAVERDALGVLRDQLGHVKQLGPTADAQPVGS